MKTMLLLLSMITTSVWADFTTEAPKVAEALRQNLMGKLQKEVQTNGAAKAVEFCHLNVKDIGAETSKKFNGAYEFGRTSHKIRNGKNTPQDWMVPYISKFKDKKQGTPESAPFYHTLSDGKKVYMEPLWVMPMCLQCHGDKINKTVDAEILKRYPSDQARGFKVGDFRGFLWVKEK